MLKFAMIATACAAVCTAAPAVADPSDRVDYTFSMAGRITSVSGSRTVPTFAIGDAIGLTIVVKGYANIWEPSYAPHEAQVDYGTLPVYYEMALGGVTTRWQGTFQKTLVVDGTGGIADRLEFSDWGYRSYPLPFQTLDPNGYVATFAVTAADLDGTTFGGGSFGNFNRFGAMPTRSLSWSASGWSPGSVSMAFTATIDDVTVSVPEPKSWAMMIAGFGLMGAGMRRRRVSAAFA